MGMISNYTSAFSFFKPTQEPAPTPPEPKPLQALFFNKLYKLAHDYPKATVVATVFFSSLIAYQNKTVSGYFSEDRSSSLSFFASATFCCLTLICCHLIFLHHKQDSLKDCHETLKEDLDSQTLSLRSDYHTLKRRFNTQKSTLDLLYKNKALATAYRASSTETTETLSNTNISGDITDFILNLLLEKLSLQAIGRVLNINQTYLLDFIEKAYNQMRCELDTPPDASGLILACLKVNELWSLEEETDVWIWLVSDATSHQVIAAHAGGRSEQDAKAFWAAVPDDYLGCDVYTIQSETYKGLIPSQFKIKKSTEKQC